jgi:predicted metal-dependent peptidase
MAKTAKVPKDNLVRIEAARRAVAAHPLLGYLSGLADAVSTTPKTPFAKSGWARLLVGANYNKEPVFHVELNPWQRGTPTEWMAVLGQAYLHIALCHVDPKRTDVPWRYACELSATELLRHLGVTARPEMLAYPFETPPGKTVEDIARVIEQDFDAARLRYGFRGLAGEGALTWSVDPAIRPFDEKLKKKHADALANGIRAAVSKAVDDAGATARGSATAKRNPNSNAERARSWFIASYPLLASLAAAFEIVESAEQCERYDIAIAAVNSEERRIYINPKFPMTYAGMQFVMAHELLHVGLRHEARRQGRDAFLWNVACDYVINGWLIEMGVGELPTPALLLDLELGFEKESAEAIYDRIVRDLRMMRRLSKCRTLRGVGLGDMLAERPPSWWTGAGCDLDTFYRRALRDGLDLHQSAGRGTLPGDMIDEIMAILEPPIPWDVQLGQWLDAFFPPLESRRSFARASRRQSSTPDIPRPVYVRPFDLMASRTFGVVLDTSGSMERQLLARELGAIASYAMSREVPLVRVIQCDAGVHDMGYVEPEALLSRVDVRGRGGTVLMPAIRLLDGAADFPKDAPLLIITDGLCDHLSVKREHAYLLPAGKRLPFPTRAPTFHFGDV